MLPLVVLLEMWIDLLRSVLRDHQPVQAFACVHHEDGELLPRQEA